MNVLKKLVAIHKLAIQAKNYSYYNLAGTKYCYAKNKKYNPFLIEIKKMLRKHDKKTKIGISTEWLHRLQYEKISTHDTFDKTISTTKVYDTQLRDDIYSNNLRLLEHD